MRRALLAGTVGAMLCHPAAADLPVIDIANIAKWGQQAQQMEQTIQQQMATVASLTDVPREIIGGFQDLLSDGVRNPLADIGQTLQSLRSGNLAGMAGTACGQATQVLGQTQYGAPVGNDFTAVSMRASAARTAGVMACAETMMQSTQSRIGRMGELLDALMGAHTITQLTGINGRIQQEHQTIAAQQLQFQTVAMQAMIMRQQQDDQIQQKMRRDSEQRARDTSSGGSGAVQPQALPAPIPFRAPGA